MNMRCHGSFGRYAPKSGLVMLSLSSSHFDPIRTSALSKYTSLDRPRRLSNAKFGQLHYRTLIFGNGHATA